MNQSSSLLIALPVTACSTAKVLAPDGDDTNPSKTGGNLEDDRIIQILSAFNCRFLGPNTR
jgi:hypothetical protein